MEVVIEMIRNVVMIILLTTFLDMLLPSGSLKPFVKVIMGLFIMLSILNPVLSLFMNEQGLEIFAWRDERSLAGFTTVLADSNRLNEVNAVLFRENYAARIALQMESMLKLLFDMEDVHVEVVLEDGEKIADCGLRGVSVTAKLMDPTKFAADSAEEIKNVLSNYFAIKPAQIKVAIRKV